MEDHGSQEGEGEARTEDCEAANDQSFFAVRCNSNLPFKKEYNRGWMDIDVIFAKKPSLVLAEIKRHQESPRVKALLSLGVI